MRKRTFVALLIGIMLLLPMISQAQAQRRRPPEYDRLRQAMRLEDLNERIKALEAIKTEFPETRYLSTIETSIIRARIGLSDSLAAILNLQQGLIDKQEGVGKLYALPGTPTS